MFFTSSKYKEMSSIISVDIRPNCVQSKASGQCPLTFGGQCMHTLNTADSMAPAIFDSRSSAAFSVALSKRLQQVRHCLLIPQNFLLKGLIEPWHQRVILSEYLIFFINGLKMRSPTPRAAEFPTGGKCLHSILRYRDPGLCFNVSQRLKLSKSYYDNYEFS